MGLLWGLVEGIKLEFLSREVPGCWFLEVEDCGTVAADGELVADSLETVSVDLVNVCRNLTDQVWIAFAGLGVGWCSWLGRVGC